MSTEPDKKASATPAASAEAAAKPSKAAAPAKPAASPKGELPVQGELIASPRDKILPKEKPAPVKEKKADLAVFEGLLKSNAGTKPGDNKKKKKGWKWRHLVVAGSFLAAVALPTALAAGYMAFIAADQYHSTASFSVRSIDSAQGSDIIGMFTQASSGTTGSDSYVLLDYIRSERIVQEAEEALPLEDIFARRGLDYFYGLGDGLPIEDRLDYWRSMVAVNYDHTSGIINLEVKAFAADDAQRIADFIVERCERLINSLSQTARAEVLAVSEREVQLSEGRLRSTREALRMFRDTSQEVDPVEGARLAAQLIASLDQQAVELRAELTTARAQMSEDTPRVRVLRSRLESVEQQIAVARQRLGSGTGSVEGGESGRNDRIQAGANSDIAGRMLSYETLETEREFAERAYTAALSSLEKARLDANGKQRYLATFIFPTLSEHAQYPTRLLNVLLVFLGGLFVWGVGVMGYYNIRDRV